MKIIILLSFLMLIVTPVMAKDQLVFSTLPGGAYIDLAEKIMREAYQRIGIDIRVDRLPAARALLQSSTGKVDGELRRLTDLDKKYPTLIKIPVPIDHLELYAFTKHEDFIVTGPESLKPYRVVVLLGANVSERVAEYAKTTIKVARWELLFRVLDTERADVAIADRNVGLYEIKRLELKNIKLLTPPLVRIELFHYLNEKNKALVPKVTKVLQEMKQSNTLQKMKEHFYQNSYHGPAS